MAHKSLLRYIFRQRTHGKSRDSAASIESTKRPRARLDAPQPPLARRSIARAAATLPKTPEPIFTALEDISEENIAGDGSGSGSGNEVGNGNENENDNDNANSDGDLSSLSTSTTTFIPSLTDTLAALNIDIETFNTRDLVTATLNEAQAAVKSHLDTLDDTLVLLSALSGSCGVVDMWEKEMRERKRACEVRKGVLEDAERVIREMIFTEEMD